MSESISEKCRHCASMGPHPITLVSNGVHYAKVNCVECKRQLRWLPKPDSDPTKYRRPTQHQNLVSDYGRGFCEMCLRKKEDLPKGNTLEAQHVVEFQDGGSNERTNIWILCTACHRMVHWVRTYHGGDYRDLVQNLVEGFDPWKE